MSVRGCIAVVFAGWLAACAAPRQSTAPATRGNGASQVADEWAGAREIEDARRLIESGDQGIAIPRLLQTISKYPNSAAAIEARYWLGIAYHKVNDYRDAIDMLNEYIRLAPGGPLAEQCKEQAALLSEEYRNKFPTPEKLDAQIARLTSSLRANPNDFGKQWELANLLWQRGDYQKAGRIYLHIIEEHPEYADDATVKGRIDRLPSGEYIALTPAEIQRRQIQESPIEIYNDAHFRGGQDLLTRKAKYYVVTGQAVNRGDSVLYGVQVTVTIYGFGNMVYGSNTVNLGRMNPGEVRAFSTQFSRLDDLNNITRYECTSTFQR